MLRQLDKSSVECDYQLGFHEIAKLPFSTYILYSININIFYLNCLPCTLFESHYLESDFISSSLDFISTVPFNLFGPLYFRIFTNYQSGSRNLIYLVSYEIRIDLKMLCTSCRESSDILFLRVSLMAGSSPLLAGAAPASHETGI